MGRGNVERAGAVDGPQARAAIERSRSQRIAVDDSAVETT